MTINGTPAVTELPAPPQRTVATLLGTVPGVPLSTSEAVGRWRNGLAWTEWGCPRTPRAEDSDYCVDAIDRSEIVDEDGVAWAETRSQSAFYLWDAIGCSTLSADYDELDRRLRYSLVDTVSYAVAQELMTGNASGGNHFADEATVLASSGVPSVVEGLAALELHFAQATHGAQGYLHISVDAFVLLATNSTIHFDGSVWRTPTGNVVIADPGYTNAVMTPDGGGAGSTTTSWMYISGPVYVTLDDFSYPSEPNTVESLDISRNFALIMAERFGIIVYDTCGLAAVKATTPAIPVS